MFGKTFQSSHPACNKLLLQASPKAKANSHSKKASGRNHLEASMALKQGL
jgi:hypothetical protein